MAPFLPPDQTVTLCFVQSVRVLWLIKGLGPGGAERLLVSSARVGDHRGFTYEVAYVLPHKTTFVQDLEALGVATHCLADPRRSWAWPLRLREHLRRHAYDVVHVHSPLLAGVARVVVRTLPRSHRPALVSTEHNVWGSYAWPTRVLNAALHSMDDQRWAVSPVVRASIWRPWRRGVDVLTHGLVMDDVDVVEGARERLRAELGLRPEEVVAITVANFRAEKAYPDLLRAARLAFDATPDLRLLIVGQGPQRELIEKMHDELGLGDRCTVLGYRADVMELLAASDFFVIASHFEGFPIALMEAMAMGLPAVGTRVGGVPEAIEHGREGILVDPGCVEELAAALVTMAEGHGERRAMALRAREKGRRYDIRAAVEVLQAAYASLARS